MPPSDPESRPSGSPVDRDLGNFATSSRATAPHPTPSSRRGFHWPSTALSRSSAQGQRRRILRGPCRWPSPHTERPSWQHPWPPSYRPPRAVCAVLPSGERPLLPSRVSSTGRCTLVIASLASLLLLASDHLPDAGAAAEYSSLSIGRLLSDRRLLHAP